MAPDRQIYTCRINNSYERGFKTQIRILTPRYKIDLFSTCITTNYQITNFTVTQSKTNENLFILHVSRGDNVGFRELV